MKHISDDWRQCNPFENTEQKCAERVAGYAANRFCQKFPRLTSAISVEMANRYRICRRVAHVFHVIYVTGREARTEHVDNDLNPLTHL